MHMHDGKGVMQSIIAGIFFQSVGADKMKDKSLDALRKPTIVSQYRKVKVCSEAVQVSFWTVSSEV